MRDNSSANDDLARRTRVCQLVASARRQIFDAPARFECRPAYPALSIPTAIPGYELGSEIHRGGQGIVYRARQLSTGRTVAIKVMREGPFSGPRDRARFEREVRVLGQLNHPNIVGILDSGTIADCAFFIMDYIEGRPLDQWVADAIARPDEKSGPQPLTTAQKSISAIDVEKILRLFANVCDAVHAAHLRGIIHRDLKPNNVLVDAAGEPHILDFGLAKLSGDSEEVTAMTMTGHFMGSLPWASPEQASGSTNKIDMRTDVYSLGVMLYQALTNRFPYSVLGSPREVLDRIISDQPIRPGAICRGIDDELDTIILKCLAGELDRRYGTAGELARDLRHYLADEPIEAKRDSTVYLLRKAFHRHRTTVAVATAFVLLLAGATVVSIRLWRQAVSQRDEAIAAARREAVARERSNAEAAKAKQIAQFAQGMLSGIDPATAGDMDKRLMRLVLDGSAERVESELSGQPEVQAAVRHTIGKAYQAIGELTASQMQLEKSVELHRRILGDENTETLVAMDDLAMLYLD